MDRVTDRQTDGRTDASHVISQLKQIYLARLSRKRNRLGSSAVLYLWVLSTTVVSESVYGVLKDVQPKKEFVVPCILSLCILSIHRSHLPPLSDVLHNDVK